ncbi:MAG: DUF4082 domain-containing protein, partial [Planctomycetota bacterium]
MKLARVSQGTIFLVLSVLVVLAFATPAEATNYPMNQRATISSGTLNYTFGWRFQSVGQSVLVTELCTRTGNHSGVTIKLWNDTGTQLAVATPTGTAGQWTQVALSSPVQLTQNSYYRVSVHVTTGGPYHYFNHTGWTGDANIRFVSIHYQPETAHNFPSPLVNTTLCYGVADIGYITGPPPPASITYPSTSVGGNFTVSWTATTGIGTVTYELEEDTTAGFTSPTQIYSGTGLSHNITNHPPGTFYYRVRGRDSIGPGGYTAGGPIVITVPPPPPPSTIIVPATSPTGSYTVQWTASAGATQYELQEANNSSFAGASQVYLGPNLSFNVSGKTGGTWWYQVRAANAGGSSAFTQSTNGCQIVAPNPPASITVPAQSASGNFTVTWAASGGATSYFLQEDTSAAFTTANTVYNGANTSFNVSGKTSGTWWYRVCARNAVGNSAWTTSTNGCQIVPPSPPPSITVPATSVDGNFTVSWTASPSGATNYDLQEDTSSSFTNPQTVYTGTNLTFNVTGKTGSTWWYRVRANGMAGSSAWTASTNGCQIVPPAAPGSITVPATSATGIYTVSWVAAVGATGYDLEEDTSTSFANATVVYTGSNLSYQVTGKSSGTFYYRVRAYNGSGSSGWTVGANGCQIIPPQAPTPLTVPPTSTTGTFTVGWGSSGAGVAYELQEDTSSSFMNPQTVYTGASLQYTVMGKMNGTYYYRVRASNGAGPSSWTTDTTGCTVTLAPPAAPGSITVPASSSTGNYVVSWTGVVGAWTYDLEESTSPAFGSTTLVYSGSSTSYSITGQVDGTYYYRVRAGNGAGQSGWTNGANGCVVQRMAPGAPGFLTVPGNSSTGNYSVDWGTVPSASLYELEEDRAADFSSAVQIYRGAGSQFQVSGRASGTYHYRVRATNVVGSSSWTPGGNPCIVSIGAPAAHVEAGPGNPGPTFEMPG